MSELRTIEQDGDDLKTAEELGVFLPEIAVDTALDQRLARRYLALEVDNLSLLPGVRDAGIEHPIGITINGVTKFQKKDKPTLNFGDLPETEEPQTVSLEIPVAPVLTSLKGSKHAINSAFWSGVLVANHLKEEKLEPVRYRTEKTDRIQRIGKYPLYAAIITPIEAIEHTSFLGDMAVDFPALILSAAVLNRVLKKYYAKTVLYRDLEKKHKNTSQELAREYPVLSYIAAE
jgi:hypothetical protein